MGRQAHTWVFYIFGSSSHNGATAQTARFLTSAKNESGGTNAASTNTPHLSGERFAAQLRITEHNSKRLILGVISIQPIPFMTTYLLSRFIGRYIVKA